MSHTNDTTEIDSDETEIYEYDQNLESYHESDDDWYPENQDDGWFGKNKTTFWKKYLPDSVSFRKNPHNILREKQGLKGPALNAVSPNDYWSLFVTNEMLNLLVSNTNEFIDTINIRHTFKETNALEMKAFLGLLLLTGIYRSNRLNLNDLWINDGTGVEIFHLTMSQRRFRFLLAVLRFDSKITRNERKKIDKIAPIRELFEIFVTNCAINYSPSMSLTIDEMLVAFRGRCSFKQYIPSKPAKYGIKIHALADAENAYVCNMEIYAGRQPTGPYMVDNSAKAVVTRLIRNISGSGRNITFDNWYTSYPLVKSLMDEYRLSAVGTLRKNKREIPPEFLTIRNRATYDSMFGFSNKITLVSYIPKSKNRKNVLLLSTMHYDKSINPESGEKKIPEIISFYNENKVGVDLADQMAASYNVSRNSKRWPLTIFFHLLNIANINSFVLYSQKSSNLMRRRIFIKNVALSLIEPILIQRMNSSYIERQIKDDIRKILPNRDAQRNIYSESKSSYGRARCYICPRNLDMKHAIKCQECKKTICVNHCRGATFCVKCLDNDSA